MQTNAKSKKVQARRRQQRREFLRSAGTLCCTACCSGALGQLLSSCEPRVVKIVGPSTGDALQPDAAATLLLSDYPALGSVGGAIKIAIPPFNDGRRLIIIRKSESEFLVVTALCTHQVCEVNLPAEPGANMICPCHGAEFSSSDGGWRDSPLVTSDLRRYPASYAAGREELTIRFPAS